jgi:nucleoside-diphosphate-sugar epimerase
MRILFIGGTGNLSAACTNQALAKNMEVFHLNRGTRTRRNWPGVTSLQADIRDLEQTRKALNGLRFDSVVQFLAYNPEHVQADISLFDGCCDQYVLISSCAAYRKPALRPVIVESTPLDNPYWDYAKLKIACEHQLIAEAACRSFPYTIIRPSHTYDNGWIPGCFGSADYGLAWRIREGKEVIVPGDGQSIWTLTHASDFAVGLVGLLGNATALGEAFHITSDEHLTWDMIHIMTGKALGVAPRIIHIPSDYIARISAERGAALLGDKSISAMFDNSKIRRFVPEFRPVVHFAEGIRRSVDWFDAHPEHKVPNLAMNQEMDRMLAYWQKALDLLP